MIFGIQKVQQIWVKFFIFNSDLLACFVFLLSLISVQLHYFVKHFVSVLLHRGVFVFLLLCVCVCIHCFPLLFSRCFFKDIFLMRAGFSVRQDVIERFSFSSVCVVLCVVISYRRRKLNGFCWDFP